MAKDPKKTLDANLASYGKPKIYFVDDKGSRINTLRFANMLDGTVALGDPPTNIDGTLYSINQEELAKFQKETGARVAKGELTEDQVVTLFEKKFLLPDKIVAPDRPHYVDVKESKIRPIFFDLEKSTDKFRVRYEDDDPALKGVKSIEVEVRTSKGIEKVILHAVGNGVFESKDLLLAANKRIDDNPKTEQTLLAGFGEVSVSYENKKEKVTVSADVPAEKVLKTRAIILLDRAGNPMATEEDVKKHFAHGQDIFNTVHTEIDNLEITTFQLPPYINTRDGLDLVEMAEIAKLTKHLTPESGANVIFAKGLKEMDGHDIPGYSVSLRNDQGKLATAAAFIKPDAPEMTLAHELSHLVYESLPLEVYNTLGFDATRHQKDPLSLMFWANLGEKNDVYRTGQYFSENDLKAFRQSTILVDPFVIHRGGCGFRI